MGGLPAWKPSSPIFTALGAVVEGMMVGVAAAEPFLRDSVAIHSLFACSVVCPPSRHVHSAAAALTNTLTPVLTNTLAPV
jgi:hypothetical protein